MTTSASNPLAPPRLHLAFLDGMRAVAALLVLISHLWILYAGHKVFPGMKGFLTAWLDNGHLWVNVFIVLSGFCLMLPVVRSGVLRGGWRAFYKSRARRILPPFYAAVGFAVAKTLLRDHHVPLNQLLVNVFLLQDIIQLPNALDGPLWSVALEWKIYFLFPPLIWLWQRFGITAAMSAAAAVSVLVLVLYTQTHVVAELVYACPWYVFLFSLGMAGADFAFRDKLPARAAHTAWLLLVFGLVLYAVQSHVWPDAPGGSTAVEFHLIAGDLLNGLAAVSLLFLLTRMSASGRTHPVLTPVFRLLSWRPLAFIGTFSYSIYLLHFLLIFAVHGFLVSHLHTANPLLLFPIDIPFVVALAYLFHLAFERPFMTKPGMKIKTETQAEAAAILNPAP